MQSPLHGVKQFSGGHVHRDQGRAVCSQGVDGSADTRFDVLGDVVEEEVPRNPDPNPCKVAVQSGRVVHGFPTGTSRIQGVKSRHRVEEDRGVVNGVCAVGLHGPVTTPVG